MASITRCDIILFALLLSLGLNIYEAYRLSVVTTGDTEYSLVEQPLGGKEISKTDADKLIMDYRKLHDPEIDKTIYKTTGWLFSKKALDNIFENKDLNTLNIDLVQHDDSLKIIFQGRHSDKTEIETKVGNSIFIVQTMCPSDCSHCD
jgi:hypothetical protein